MISEDNHKKGYGLKQSIYRFKFCLRADKCLNMGLYVDALNEMNKMNVMKSYLLLMKETANRFILHTSLICLDSFRLRGGFPFYKLMIRHLFKCIYKKPFYFVFHFCF